MFFLESESPTLNAIAKVRRNSCDQVFLGMTLLTKFTMTAAEGVLINLFSLTVISQQIIRMKTWNTMAVSYHSKVTLTQNKRVTFFYCLAQGVVYLSASLG